MRKHTCLAFTKQIDGVREQEIQEPRGKDRDRKTITSRKDSQGITEHEDRFWFRKGVS